MAIIADVSQFDDVYELAITDPVRGGSDGASNSPLQNLANRTRWLKDAIDVLESGGGPFDYNASGGLVPTHTTNTPGGSGIAGAIVRKDQFVVTVAGVVSGTPLQAGDSLIAKQNAPTLITHYVIVQGNAVLATDTVLGLVKLGQNIAGGPQADKVLSITGLINLFAQLNSPTFTGSPKAPTQAQTDHSTNIATTKYVTDAVAAEIVSRSNADGVLQGNINSEAAARTAADNALQNNINTEIANRTTDVNDEETARIAAINAEAALRGAADNALQLNINAIDESNIGWLSTAGAGIVLSTGWVVIGANLQIRKIRGIVNLRGNVRKTSGPAAASGDVVINLPAPYRPLQGYAFLGLSKNINSGYLQLEFDTTGNVTVREQGKVNGVALTDTAICFDGISFDLAH